MSDPTQRFTHKAALYARYRPGYAPQAIDWLFEITGLGADTCAADLGAGTGILAAALLPRLARLYAIEPNQAMRSLAEQQLGDQPGCLLLPDRAEGLSLPDASLDLITVGQALSWFDPQPARAEMQRVLKPDGWLAVIDNLPEATESDLKHAIRELHAPQYGYQEEPSQHSQAQPPAFYFASGQYQQREFPNPLTQSWPAFLGGMRSESIAPQPEHPCNAAFETQARRIFDRFQVEGRITLPFVTRLLVGRMPAR